MYKDMASALDSENIRYYLAYGSVIGAVRHKGFIPWDDDIDIAVMEEDLDKVDSALEKNLDKGRYYYQRRLVDSHPHVILKTKNMVKDLNEKKAPFIDIFVIAKYPSTWLRRKFYNTAVWGELIASNILNRINSITCVKLFSWSVGFFAKIRKMVVDENSGLTTVVDYYFKRCIFEKTDYGEPAWASFENISVPIPQKYDSMLTQIYGEYMTPPDDSDRTGASGYPCCAAQQYILDMERDTKP